MTTYLTTAILLQLDWAQTMINRNLAQCVVCGTSEPCDVAETTLRAFSDDLNRDRAGRLLAMWRHTDRLTDRERDAAAARFQP